MPGVKKEVKVCECCHITPFGFSLRQGVNVRHWCRKCEKTICAACSSGMTSALAVFRGRHPDNLCVDCQSLPAEAKPTASGIGRQWSLMARITHSSRALPAAATALPEFAVTPREPPVSDPVAQISYNSAKCSTAFQTLVAPVTAHLARYTAVPTDASVPAEPSLPVATIDVGLMMRRLNELAWVSPASVVAGLILLDRLADTQPVTAADAKVKLVVCIRLASKVLENNTCNNRKYANVFLIPADVFNAAEAAALEALDFNCTVLREDFDLFALDLLGRHGELTAAAFPQ